jgi:hypothetical protein
MELELKVKYKSGRDNIIQDFYIPVLTRTLYYKRAVGYFSSQILHEYVRSLEKLVMNNGKVFLIISPFIGIDDYEVLEKATDRKKIVTEYTDNLFKSFINGTSESLTSTQLLFVLIKKNILEVKIAVPKNRFGIFHEKVGVFEDLNGNIITILGSNNETKSAVNINHESFHVFKSWKDGQIEYCNENVKDFEAYWSNTDNNLEVYDIQEAISENILKKVDSSETIEDLYRRLKTEEKKHK